MAKNNTPLTPALSDVPVTMSSREIADMCGKKHGHVSRDIRSMMQSLGIPEEGYIQKWIDPQNGREYKEYRLNKELSFTLVSGYKVEMRHAIVQRWMELEDKARTPSHSIPQTFGDALRLAAEQADKIAEQEKRISVMEPDVAGFERIAKASGGSMCITNAAKVLQERPKDLFGWLHANGWIYRRNGAKSWTAYSDKCKSGHLEHKVTSITRGDGSEKVCESVRVTGKGLVRLAKEFGVSIPTEESARE